MAVQQEKYIKRNIKIDGQIFSQDKLLENTKVIVVLGEPGAGKTELLENLAAMLNTTRDRAGIFRHKNSIKQSNTLVIDGLDEVAKIDQSAIDAIIVKAAELDPARVVFASRSAQWEVARTQTVKDVFGSDPVIATLHPLDENEQEQLFNAYRPEQNFRQFKSSLEKLDVGELLGNPQMLKTFADAYAHSGGKFSTKKQVFCDAIEQLASEHNKVVIQADRPSNLKVIAQGDELFCKMLLSGCAGISATEATANRDFPYFAGLTMQDSGIGKIALETSLFRPSDKPDQHEPVHRIVAEYSAARYLIKRVEDSTDRLSLKRVLSLIAPNNTPRDELRGLLAWMATEGSSLVEQAVIDIDPYSILSNGDPSQLSISSKSMLLKRLAEVAEQNPYFRGNDVWRHFSATGFFTDDIVETTRTILDDPSTSVQLRMLLLELLKGTPAVTKLASELNSLLLNSEMDESSRILALRNLHTQSGFDAQNAFALLLNEESHQSISLAAELVKLCGVTTIGRKITFSLLMAIDRVYFPTSENAVSRRIDGHGSRYFITTLIQSFDTLELVYFLDELSRDLTCRCSSNNRYKCHCRYGRSKLIGKLLDKLFELAELKPTAEQLFGWTKALRYEFQNRNEDSPAVAALQKDDELRREIHRISFGNLKNQDEIHEVKFGMDTNDGHGGLLFKHNDYQALTDFAFQTDNVFLWASFIEYHRPNRTESFENPYRAHMRRQAREKTEFGRLWMRNHQLWHRGNAEHRRYHLARSARMRKRRQRERHVSLINQEHFYENRQLIEAGEHWGWLEIFARGYLHDNNEHFPDIDDDQLPIRALCNCFQFLLPDIPDLKKIGSNTNTYRSVVVAHAACLAHFRTYGNLANIDIRILKAVKTQSNIHYSKINDINWDAFDAEINTRIFTTDQELEQFARQFFESQLASPDRMHTDVGWLAYRNEFKSLSATLPMEWLERFPNLHLSIISTLFDIVASHGSRQELLKHIDAKITAINQLLDNTAVEEHIKARDFWFLRRFSFFDQCDGATVSWLQSNKETALMISGVSSHDDPKWDGLSANKIRLVLEIFIDQWPKVHLPSSWGTGDPPEQTAYRFLKDIVWKIGNDDPIIAIPVLDKLLADQRFIDFQSSLKTQKSSALKQIALRGFLPPSPDILVRMLDNQQVATVEDMRALLIEFLEDVQAHIYGSEFDPVNYFYNKQTSGELIRVDENTATKFIADRLELQCNALGLSIIIEHHLHEDKRCDLTLRINLDGIERLLVIEAKGQWHRELYTAAAEQLDKRYAIHPAAAGQGVYLVFWFGEGHEVAGLKTHDIKTSQELQQQIIDNMPKELTSRIDVVVLDVSIK